MKRKDYSTTLVVPQSPEAVYNAINHVKGWWSEMVEGGTEQLNDEFVYRHKDLHYSRQRLIELDPNKRVVWLVTDSCLSFTNNKSEWTGTKVVFEISSKGDKTQLLFTHEGLNDDVECFEACSGGWNYYVGSLRDLIVTGEGKPDREL